MPPSPRGYKTRQPHQPQITRYTIADNCHHICILKRKCGNGYRFIRTDSKLRRQGLKRKKEALGLTFAFFVKDLFLKWREFLNMVRIFRSESINDCRLLFLAQECVVKYFQHFPLFLFFVCFYALLLLVRSPRWLVSNGYPAT